MATETPLVYITKAEKWLRWCDTSLRELNKYGEEGRMDDVERLFVQVITQLTTVHEALSSAAKRAGLTDWDAALDRLRKTDPLLLYVWKGRGSESHGALLKWTPDTNANVLRIVDSKAFFQTGAMFYRDRSDGVVLRRVMRYIFDAKSDEEMESKMGALQMPSPERLRQAGVEIVLFDSLTLRDFSVREKGKVLHVKAPHKHVGKFLPATAHHAIDAAIRFYHQKYQELVAALALPDALGPRSPLAPLP